MKRITRNNSDQGRLSREERTKYFNEMESVLSPMSNTDQHLLRFAKDFVNRLHLYNAKDGDIVQLGPLDIRLMEYLIISIVVAYQETRWNS